MENKTYKKKKKTKKELEEEEIRKENEMYKKLIERDEYLNKIRESLPKDVEKGETKIIKFTENPPEIDNTPVVFQSEEDYWANWTPKEEPESDDDSVELNVVGFDPRFTFIKPEPESNEEIPALEDLEEYDERFRILSPEERPLYGQFERIRRTNFMGKKKEERKEKGKENKKNNTLSQDAEEKKPPPQEGGPSDSIGN